METRWQPPERLRGAPTLPITAEVRATLAHVVTATYGGTGGPPEPCLTLWSRDDITFESWRPYWLAR